ncbi:hypothetical protein P4T31_02515 [Bacillus paramycoides]|nr:hypothetical protein [Bacillus paramycoides]
MLIIHFFTGTKYKEKKLVKLVAKYDVIVRVYVHRRNTKKC